MAALAGAAVGCSDPSSPLSCAADSTLFSGNVCLVLGSPGEFEAHRSLIELEVDRALAAARSRLPVANLTISFLSDPSRVIPEIGIGGYNPSAGEVQVFLEPDEPDIAGIVQRELLGILAHEIHHAIRRRTVGYGSSLFQAVVSEGLADHFALEVGGGDPQPWSVALTQGELETWTPPVLDGTAPGYDHGQWFFGTSPSIPRWTGYAVGFGLVSEYLAANPTSSASGLVGEPAEIFHPLQE